MQLSIDGIIQPDNSKLDSAATERRSVEREVYQEPLPTGMLHDDLFSADLRASGMVFFEKVTVGQLTSRLNRRSQTTSQHSSSAAMHFPGQTIPVMSSEEQDTVQGSLFDEAIHTDDLEYADYHLSNYEDTFDGSMYDLPYPQRQGFGLALAQFTNGVHIAREGIAESIDVFADKASVRLAPLLHRVQSKMGRAPEVVTSMRRTIATQIRGTAQKLGFKRQRTALYIHRAIIAGLASALIISLL